MSWGDPPSHPAKKLPGGQQDLGHGVVLRVLREGYQQTKTFRSGSNKVAQGLKEAFQFQNPIFLLVIVPIPCLGLNLIDPRSSFKIKVQLN